jgi:hypothetical protein
MPGPFPGMDPYLEAPNRWRGLDLQLINNIVEDLQPQLVPRYVARPEERVLLGPLHEAIEPDASVHETEKGSGGGVHVVTRVSAPEVTIPEIIEVPELTVPHRFVEIRDVDQQAVVTVIEILSPWNKTGRGRDDHRHKQEAVLLSDANLVEIDLLRRGQHTVAVPADRLLPSDYRVCTHRAQSRRFEVNRFGIRDPLPNVGIPLGDEDADVVLHLGDVFNRCYDTGAYAYLVEYASEPDPPLSPEDAAWASERLEGHIPRG